MTFTLEKPSAERLGAYSAVLQRGWSPSTVRNASREQLEEIERDPQAFLAGLDDPNAKGAPVELPDGSTVPRLPSFQRWMWDDEFCGVISLRWQNGTAALPPTCLGHVGFLVVPWKQRRGYATRALASLLPEARKTGLPYIDATTDPDNLPSQKVILANGGKLVERFCKPAEFGGKEALRFRILLHS